jgi:hypothetical protein
MGNRKLFRAAAISPNGEQNYAAVLRPLTLTNLQGAKLLSEDFMTLAFHSSGVILTVMRRQSSKSIAFCDT